MVGKPYINFLFQPYREDFENEIFLLGFRSVRGSLKNTILFYLLRNAEIECKYGCAQRGDRFIRGVVLRDLIDCHRAIRFQRAGEIKSKLLVFVFLPATNYPACSRAG